MKGNESPQIVSADPHRGTKLVRFKVASSDPTANSFVTNAKLVGDLLDREKPDLASAARSNDLVPLMRGRAPDPCGDECFKILQAIGNAAPREFDERRSTADHAQAGQMAFRDSKPGCSLVRGQKWRNDGGRPGMCLSHSRSSGSVKKIAGSLVARLHASTKSHRFSDHWYGINWVARHPQPPAGVA
jgi:hypothetical protein